MASWGELGTRRHPLQPRDLIPKLAVLGPEYFVLADKLVTASDKRCNNTAKVEIAILLVNAAAKSHQKRESKIRRLVQPFARKFAPLTSVAS